MKQLFFVFILLLIFIPTLSYGQELVIDSFPFGYAGSIEDSFFEPYYPELQKIADSLQKYSLLRAVITGSADGMRYNRDMDAKNPSLALGRALTVRGILINKFNVDSTRLEVTAIEVREISDHYRYASIKLDWDLQNVKSQVDELAARPEPVIPEPVVVEPVYIDSTKTLEDNMGIRLGAGVSTAPFGALPIVTGAIGWKREIYFEAFFGHTFWNRPFTYEGEELDTKRRIAGARIIYFPWEDKRIGFLGGWKRAEQVSELHHEYVKLSEGLLLGVRIEPLSYLSITGMYNPSKHRLIGEDEADAKNGQFKLQVSLFIELGGRR